MRKLTVYGWTGWRNEYQPAPNGNRQTREICAATSKAEIIRFIGPSYKISEIISTGNAKEIELAMRFPGVVFWRPLDGGKFISVKENERWPEN